MYHLDYGAESDHAMSGIALRLGGKEQQRRPTTLAAALAQVVGDFRDGFDGGDGVVAELALDSAQVVVEEVEDLFCRRYGRCAHWLFARAQKTRSCSSCNSTGS